MPITVNVFTADQIRAAGIQRPADFIAMVPNMSLVETQNAGNAFVVVRGISQARNSESSVAVLVDGVLQTNPAEFSQEMFDIQQIEVLKGPQGALYGRNAIGGAIIVRTKEPGDHSRRQPEARIRQRARRARAGRASADRSAPPTPGNSSPPALITIPRATSRTTFWIRTRTRPATAPHACG